MPGKEKVEATSVGNLGLRNLAVLCSQSHSSAYSLTFRYTNSVKLSLSEHDIENLVRSQFNIEIITF